MIAARGLDSGSPLLDMIRKVILDILQHHDVSEGVIMEKCFERWLRVRIKCANDCNKRILSLHQLLNTSGQQPFDMEIAMHPLKEDTNPLPSSYSVHSQSTTRDQFLRALAQRRITNFPIILPLAAKDRFDCVLFVKGKTTTDVEFLPFLIFFECKSQQELVPKESDKSYHIDTKQYEHVEEVLYNHASENKIECDKNSALHAFQSGRWAFVYLSSHSEHGPTGQIPDVQYEKDGIKFTRIFERGYQVTRPDLERFFGPMWSLFCSLRAANTITQGKVNPVGKSDENKV
eukprot:c20689_g1_i1.p1 GENE.c20689_g1_i1~~c20689_g1_i1.p1  ORF type:complete len:289 (+),score=42.20 c20689_g1_i1:344-1210(+)